MKSFLKVLGIAYAGGICGMWLFVLIMLSVRDSLEDILNAITGMIMIPFTPLGLPFFIGACAAIAYRDRRANRRLIESKVNEIYRGM